MDREEYWDNVARDQQSSPAQPVEGGKLQKVIRSLADSLPTDAEIADSALDSADKFSRQRDDALAKLRERDAEREALLELERVVRLGSHVGCMPTDQALAALAALRSQPTPTGEIRQPYARGVNCTISNAPSDSGTQSELADSAVTSDVAPVVENTGHLSPVATAAEVELCDCGHLDSEHHSHEFQDGYCGRCSCARFKPADPSPPASQPQLPGGLGQVEALREEIVAALRRLHPQTRDQAAFWWDQLADELSKARK